MKLSVFNGSLPKIGIRPTIDGRLGGVRESLEKQTMDQAKAAAKLISSTLRYPNGEPVECVIADTCIGGVAEAAACAEKFARENVGVSLTVTPCWCYGSETMDMNPLIPKAIWGFNGTERPGAVYLAAVLAGHTQKGIPAFSIYGRDVQDGGDKSIPADVQEKILRFVRAGLSVALMRGKSYLGMGGVSMGIAGSIVDQHFFEDYLGMRVETIDMTEFLRRMDKGIYDQAEYKKALAWVKENCPEGKDYNSPKTKRERKSLNTEWEKSVKMSLIVRDLMSAIRFWRRWVLAKKRKATTPSRPVFKASASGRIISPTAIFSKRFSTRPSTGTEFVRHISSQRKTIVLTALRCCSVICSQTPRRFLPTCGLTGAQIP